MSIPLDRLYHYIENIAEKIYGGTVIIYRFYPHGSKKLEDLHPIKCHDWTKEATSIAIHCNDQEPLNFDFYKNYDMSYTHIWTKLLQSLDNLPKQKNLKNWEIYDQSILIHSEKRSSNLTKYQQDQYITVYYWNHALLALDWFRYAKNITTKQNQTKNFLIYNRAWTGTREYRLKFADLLVDNNLVIHCQTSVGFVDHDIHYSNHKFINQIWQPSNQLENYFDDNTTLSSSSADFSIDDYLNTNIEVVLETLFDDERLHLTEKSLRPIACGHPFILAATHGSLEYLRSYGFKTFNGIIDESYDIITDPEKRLQHIVDTMKQISMWSYEEKNIRMAQLQEIANYNKQHFFSSSFFEKIVNELKENLKIAVSTFNSKKSCDQFIDKWNQILSHKSTQEYLKSNGIPTKHQVITAYAEAVKYSSLRIDNQYLSI